MDPITIAAIVAMLGGAAMQYKASTDASNRTRQQTMLSLQRQKQFQMQAEQRAADTARTYAPEDRKKEQAAIADQITADLSKPVVEAQNINANAATAQGDVSQDYNRAKAESNVTSLKTAETLARLMGRTTSATRLRENENVRFADSANDIARIGNFAAGTSGVDKLAIDYAGVPDAGLQLAGGLTSALGGAALMGGGGGMGSLFGEGAGEATKAAAAAGASKLWGAGANGPISFLTPTARAAAAGSGMMWR